MSLNGATVLVTGGNGQVGWGVAHAARDAGASLVLTASRAASAARLTEEFPDADVMVADLRDDGAVALVSDRIEDRGGRLDHVVAPIGSWWQQGPTLEQPTQELLALLNTYAGAQHRLLRATAPYLEDRAGSYTMVTGAAGQRAIPGAGMLVVAVRAQWGLGDVLRAELADARFRFNEVRIRTRIEREGRSGVVPARTAGTAFVEVMAGDARSELVHYPD